MKCGDHNAAPTIVKQSKRTTLPSPRVVIGLELDVPNAADRASRGRLELRQAPLAHRKACSMIGNTSQRLCHLTPTARRLALAHQFAEGSLRRTCAAEGEECEQEPERPERYGCTG